MSVLSIQSQVAYGHVGNSAAAFPLQHLGFEVWQVPTVVLSNHPGHGKTAGRVTPAGELAELIDGIAALGVLKDCRAILSGYLGDAENGAVLLEAVGRARAENPAAIWLCDPVIGDAHTGVYVRDGIPDFFRDQASAAANMLTPNQFELQTLTGMALKSLEDVAAACAELYRRGGTTVVCTSVTAGLPNKQIGVFAFDGTAAWLASTSRLKDVPHGGGDLLSALLLAHLLKGADLPTAVETAVRSTYSVIAKSVDARSRELLLIDERQDLLAPSVPIEFRQVL
ncbi:MAG: pyridoxal kinase PdxY [Minwuiales bacterium]|nr:pyridoxal kinase PdxY [Minwuiales bacterium]